MGNSKVERFSVLKQFLTEIGLLAADQNAALEKAVGQLLSMSIGYTKVLAPLIWFAAWARGHRSRDLKVTPEERVIMGRFSRHPATAITAASAIMIRLREGDPAAKEEIAILLKVARYVSEAEKKNRVEGKKEGGVSGESSLQ